MVDDRTIAILCGGGLTPEAGGIGQFCVYWLDAWECLPGSIRPVVVDTRGTHGRLAGVASFCRAATRLASMRLGGRLALLHANMSTRGSALRKCLLCRAAQVSGTPTVIHMHGADFDEFYRRQGWLFRAFMRSTLRRCARVIVLGAAWRDFMTREVGLPESLVAVVPNGVPAPDAVADRTARQGPPRIAFLGRLGARKGVPELLTALARPSMRKRAWRATLAGDGELTRFAREVTALGLERRVDLPGWLDRSRTGCLLSEADIFVLPSHHEAMPLALLEAMSYGAAIVATPVGSNTEFLRHEQNALLVPPGDDAALAAALERLLDDASLRARIGAAGRELFSERLEIGHAARRIAEIHAAALRTPSRRGRSA